MTRSGLQFFTVCGLRVCTDEPLGDLPMSVAPPGAADLRIEWRGTVPERPGDAPLAFTTTIGTSRLAVYRVDGGTLWEYPDDTRIWLSGTFDCIRCGYPSHYVVADVATYLLGPLLGFVLRQRAVPTLHASTVRIGEGSLAIAGPAGAGKSTLAAALVGRGHRLVAEDVSAIRDVDGRRPVVLAGVPFIKLWPDSALAHGSLPLLTPNWDKHYLVAPTGNADATLSAVLFLELGAAIAVRRLSPREALVSLLDNVYVAYALSAEQRRDDLAAFAALAETVPMFALARTEDPTQLEALCDAVETTLQ